MQDMQVSTNLLLRGQNTLYVCLETFSCFLQLINRAFVSIARCLGFFLFWSFWYHRIQMHRFTRESVDCFACCICHCSTSFIEDHAKKDVQGQICYS